MSLLEFVAGKLPHLNILAIDLFADQKSHPIEEQKVNDSDPNSVNYELIGYTYVKAIHTKKLKSVLSLEDSELSNRDDSPAFLSHVQSFCPRSRKTHGYQVDWMRDRQFIRELNYFNQGQKVSSAQYDCTSENLVSFYKNDEMGHPIISVNNNPIGYPGDYIVKTRNYQSEYTMENLSDLEDPIFEQNYDGFLDRSHLEHLKRSSYHLLMNAKLNRVISFFLNSDKN